MFSRVSFEINIIHFDLLWRFISECFTLYLSGFNGHIYPFSATSSLQGHSGAGAKLSCLWARSQAILAIGYLQGKQAAKHTHIHQVSLNSPVLQIIVFSLCEEARVPGDTHTVKSRNHHLIIDAGFFYFAILLNTLSITNTYTSLIYIQYL